MRNRIMIWILFLKSIIFLSNLIILVRDYLFLSNPLILERD